MTLFARTSSLTEIVDESNIYDAYDSDINAVNHHCYQADALSVELSDGRNGKLHYDRDETPVVVITDGGSYMRHSDSCPRDCGLCDDEDPTRTDEYEDIRDSEAIRADIREEFLGRVLSRDINPWQLVSPDAKTLWVYA